MAAATKQTKRERKLGNINGKLVKRPCIHEGGRQLGYCFNGSANNPPKAGDISQPHDRIPITIPMSRRSSSLFLATSVAMAFVTLMVPLLIPAQNLQIRAAVKDGDEPKRREKTPARSKVLLMTKTLP
jgi:hypothetical protein